LEQPTLKQRPKNSPLRKSLALWAVFGVLAGPAWAAAPRAQAAGTQVATTEQPNKNVKETVVVHPGDGVAAIVNDSVISDYDLNQRIALFLATSGQQPPPDKMAQIRTQVLKQLETERLQLLEAQKKNISVSAADVDKAIDNILKENNLKKEQLEEMLSRGGVAMATLRSQIAVGIAWSKTVQDQYGDRINITTEDVNDELKRIAEGAHKPHFLVAEIFLSVDNPEQDEKVKKDAEGLIAQIQQGAPFTAVARQFSQNPTAAQGGDIGVVHEGQLAPELNNALVKLKAGEISPPIRSTGGYYILLLRERQEGMGTKLPDPKTLVTNATPPGTLPLSRILLPTGDKPDKQLLENAMKAASMLHDRIESCEMAQKVPQAVQGAVFMNLGTMKLADLSQQMQDALAKTGPGEVTQPFQSPAGIELIVRCDKAPPKVTVFKMPSRDQVENQLFEEQITTLSRQYMRNLRRTANVETKIK
jgi:peptidyl-prolyl cis-trans isomerase SurA